MTERIPCSPEVPHHTFVANAVTIRKVLKTTQSRLLDTIDPGECNNFQSLSEQINRLAPEWNFEISAGDVRSFLDKEKPQNCSDTALESENSAILLAPRLIDLKSQDSTFRVSALTRCSRSTASLSPRQQEKKRARSYNEEDFIGLQSTNHPKNDKEELATTLPVPLRFESVSPYDSVKKAPSNV
ncbi:MAG: hypothetical protein L6R37_006007 [Teloschistes peruensis]|nr:MAG: hypothetical protein L6R37_006007 [Teloschistes peruensis]